MKYAATLMSLVALNAGCVTTTDSYCDIASPLYFNTPVTVEWLSGNDPSLLRDIVIHNEQFEGICGG
jgi:hypothetical protein